MHGKSKVDWNPLRLFPLILHATYMFLFSTSKITSLNPLSPFQSPQLQCRSAHTEAQLLPCVGKLAQLLSRMTVAKQQAVREKYSAVTRLRVAKLPVLSGRTVKDIVQLACTKT